MSDPYRTNATPPTEPREMTPEEEMKLLMLDSECDAIGAVDLVAGLLAPPALLAAATPFVRRWRMLRRLRAAGVDVKR